MSTVVSANSTSQKKYTRALLLRTTSSRPWEFNESTELQMVTQRRRPRQMPVSCQLCRSMKLKCNRERPCSNCVTRGVPCEQAGSVPHAPPTTSPQTSSSDGSKEEILARLKRLEDIVLRSHAARDKDNVPGATAPQSPASPSYISEGEGVSRWLENVGTRLASVESGLSNTMTFRVITVEQAIMQATPGGIPVGGTTMTIWMPTKSEAFWMIERYAEYITFLHHVVHIPSVRLLAEEVYRRLFLGLKVESSHAALLLTIFASTAYNLESNSADTLFLNQPNAVRCALLWSKSAIDALEYSRRATQGSLEDVQATIISSLFIFNLEGFTARFRMLNSSAVIIARDLSLHRIDADITKDEDPVQLEIKRRLWWHLSATDWILALTGGPQEGTYLIHPNHMCVNYPRNIDDVDLENPDPAYCVPMDQPTAMSYYMLRIRLAEICRTVVDTLPPLPQDWGKIDYKTIIALDQKFAEFQRNLPVYLRHDEASRQQSHDVDRQYPQMMMHRYVIASSFYPRRFKLNQPFLTRVSLDPRYAYSRNVSLESARSAISMHLSLRRDMGPLSAMYERLAAFLHMFFLATAVLVLDLCINRDGNVEAQRQEIMVACRALKNAEESSSVAGQYLKSLTDILRKYRIEVAPDVASLPETHPHDQGVDIRTSEDPTPVIPGISLEGLGDLDEMWQSFMNAESTTLPAWDDLLAAVDEGPL
ncbi:hypothetical protein BDV25DRAFT_147157 [Aspergillus avenaceus]|uniref:Zn(2)-C6 fungal-type domain-containing protein n=1 Tax=Aspergillus avenaceus TaxID=36643 RepID=A0A5N6U8Z3_ASPAV|nr:hypothetical protein BDV25DRAFT_147157 [Aspergillus avenaceus]